MPTSKLCAQCGNELSVKTSAALRVRFCSAECRKAGKSVQKVCLCCGKEFSTPRRRSDEVKFCSWECRVQAGNKETLCARCGKPFVHKQNEDRQYCSKACYHEATKGVSRNAQPETWHYLNCEECGKAFHVIASRKGKARFCSKACQHKNPAYLARASESQKGEKSWRWMGGLYQLSNGYISARGVRVYSKGGRRFNHRLVIEQAMMAAEPNHPFLIVIDGVKKLDPAVEVHHIDRKRSNNDLSNLLAVTKPAHARVHHGNHKPHPWECWPSNPERW